MGAVEAIQFQRYRPGERADYSTERRGTTISVIERGAATIGDHRIRYLIVGAGTNALYFGLFWAGWHVFEPMLPYLVVTAAANLTTALVVYPAYRSFVFGSSTGWLRGFSKFYTVYLAGLVCALLGMPLLIEVFGLPVLLAQGIMIAVVPVLSYLLHRFWTFADKTPTPRADTDAAETDEVPAPRGGADDELLASRPFGDRPRTPVHSR